MIPFVQNYTIILQHWGFLLGLTGIFMIIAAFRADWRHPVLIYSALEKPSSFIWSLQMQPALMRGACGPAA